MNRPWHRKRLMRDYLLHGAQPTAGTKPMLEAG